MTQRAQPTSDLTTTSLAKALATELDITPHAARDTLTAVFDVITRTVAAGHDVAITNFGTFRARQFDQRTARNPQTGQPVTVPATQAIRFRVSTNLRAVIAARDTTATIRKQYKHH